MTHNTLKFGTNTLVEVSVKILHIFGTWPKKNSTVFYLIVGHLFQALTTFGWTIAKCIGTVLLEERNEIIMLTASSIYCVVAAYRGFVFMRNYKAIDTCLNVISQFSLSDVENEIIQQKIKTFSKTSTAYPAFYILGLVSAFLNPVLSDERVLPVPIWLPFVHWKDNDRDFYIALTFSAMGILSMVIVCAFTPVIVWYLMYASTLTLEVLGSRLRNLGYEPTDQNEFSVDLIRNIKLHQAIVENIKKIKESLSGVFLLQITSSAVCICSAAYLMASETASKNLNNFAMYVFLGGTYIFEIFVLIYYGNEIALASDRLSFCVYESNWTCMSMTYRKLMIVIVEQWRKPQEMIVGKIFPMRMKLLSSILNVAYSIFNVLRKDQQ